MTDLAVHSVQPNSSPRLREKVPASLHRSVTCVERQTRHASYMKKRISFDEQTPHELSLPLSLSLSLSLSLFCPLNKPRKLRSRDPLSILIGMPRKTRLSKSLCWLLNGSSIDRSEIDRVNSSANSSRSMTRSN